MFESFLFLVFLVMSSSRIVQTSMKQYITNSQWKRIQNIIQNPEITPDMRKTLNKAIYEKYSNWAISKAFEFKKHHRHKCHHIHPEELSIYACKGLTHAVRNYNGTSEFTKYAKYYITGELYNGLSKLHPICNIPLKIRKKSKPERAFDEDYRNRMDSLFVGTDKWKLENAVFENEARLNSQMETNLLSLIDMEEYRDFWKRRISGLSSIEKQVLKYKYDFYLNRIRNHREIAEMLGCSEEWIRKIFIRSISKIIF